MAVFNDQSYLLLQGMLTNGGVGDEKPACRILYISAQGKAENQVSRGGDWSYASRFKKLTLNECKLTQTAQGITWLARTDDLFAKVYLSGKPKRYKLPSIPGEDEDDFFTSDIIYPWAAVRAEVKTPKVGRVSLKGSGVLNHTRSTLLPPKTARRWLKFYTLSSMKGSEDAPPALVTVRLPPKSGQPTGWTWSHGESRPRKLSAQELKQLKPWITKGVPSEGTLKLDHGEPLALKRLRRIFTYEPVRQYGMMGRLAKRWIGDPINKMTLVKVKRGSGTLLGVTEEIEIR